VGVRPSTEASGRSIVVKAVAQFTAAGLLAALIVGAALAIASRRLGEREAINDAKTQTIARAQGFVEPRLTDGLVTLDETSLLAIDDVVRSDVLDDQLVRMKLWTRDGRIVYSDEPQLIGAEYDLGDDEVAAMDQGLIEAEISDLSKPENRFETQYGKLLEVYLPVRLPNEDRLLFEAYFRYERVSANGSRVWRSFAPISLGALAALQLVQIPLAWSLARQLQQRQRERESLLQRALEASDVERRRIAADLHDGVVQDLAGVAFALSGAARKPDVPERAATLLDRSADDVRESIRVLRSLLIEIYPPNLAEEGLGTAMTDLAARFEPRGLTVSVDIAAENLPHSVAALFYRVAQESLRNVVKHAQARHATVTVRVEGRVATLEVGDDGVGFDADATGDATRDGHFGLHTLRQLVDDAGGRLRIESGPASGTLIEVEVSVP
jgi:signal transduction histidine kinase